MPDANWYLEQMGLGNEKPAPLREQEYKPIPFPDLRADKYLEQMGLGTGALLQRQQGAIPELPEPGASGLTLAEMLAASDDPVEELAQFNSARFLADRLRLDPLFVSGNLEEVSKYWLGKVIPPATLAQSVKNAWDMGKKYEQISKIGQRLMYSATGEDPEAFRQIAEIEKSIEPLKELPRPWARNFFQNLGELVREGLLTNAQSGPLMLSSYFKGGMMGAASAAAAGAALSATPMGLAAAGITAGMSVPAVTAAMGAVGFVSGSTQDMMESMRGTNYIRMRQDGIPHNIASNLANIEGTIEGAMESLGNLFLLGVLHIPVPGAGKIFSKMASRVTLKLMSTGALGLFGRAIVRALETGTGEGVEEVGQEITSIIFDMLAREAAKETIVLGMPEQRKAPGAPAASTKEAWDRVKAAARGGFLAGVIMGGGAAPLGIRADVRQMQGVKTLAAQIPTRMGFINSAIGGELFEEVKDTPKLREFLGKVWDQQHPGKAPAVPIAPVGAPAAPGVSAVMPAAEVITGPEGRTHTEVNIRTTTREGVTATLLAGDPATGKRYGYVDFETVGDRVYIQDRGVVNETEKDIRRELVLDLAARYPGQEIEWNPTDELDIALKEDLVATNPRGPEAGLQWFEGVAPAAQQALTRGLFVQRMGELFTADTPAQAELFGKLADTFARVAGQSTEDWLRQYISPEVTVTTAETVAALKEGKEGRPAVASTRFMVEGQQILWPSVDEFKGQVKAVFTAMSHADFHHGIHEFFHAVERLALSPDQVKKFETALGNLREKWTYKDVEKLATYFEDYLATGKAPTEELRSVFQQIAAALKALISFIRERLGGEPGLLSPEFQAAYDALFKKPESGLATAAVETPPAAPVIVSQVEEGAPPSAQGAITIINPSTVPPEEIELSRITLSEEVPNFKEMADKKGIIEPLKAEEYAPVGIAPVTLWERMDGRLELITGRHRLDLAQRLHLPTILSQIVREADGFTAAMAMTHDAIANIRDGQGSVRDYANYFRNTTITEKEASRGGFLDRDKGRAGFAIGRYAAAGLYSLYRDAQISEAKTAAIAAASLGDERLQSLGITKAKTLTADELGNFLALARQQITTVAGVQGDMFGFDDSLIREGEKIAKAVSAKKAELLQERQALSSALRLSKGAQAKIVEKYGFKSGDTAAIQDRVDVLGEELATWGNWTQDSEKMREARTLAGLEVSALMHEEEGPPEPPPFELVPFSDKLLRPKAEKVVQPIFDFAKKTDVEIKDELDNLSLFHRDEELQEKFNAIAVKMFGTTDDPKRGAWVLSNGKMLDFDWETHKATATQSRYYGRLSHVEIVRVFAQIEPNRMLQPAAYTGAWRAGTLRMDVDLVGGVSVQSTMIPSPEQMQTIEYAIAGKDMVTLEINGTDIDERTLAWQTIDSPTMKDVRRFYARATSGIEGSGQLLYHEDLPEAPPIPEKGHYPAVQTDDGGLYVDLHPEQSTHVLFMQRMGIPPERIVSGGWITDGVYESSERSDTMRFVERYKAHLRATGKRLEALLHPEDWQGEFLYGTPVDAEIYQQYVDLAKGFESAEAFRADMESKYGEPGEADIEGEKATQFYQEVWDEAHKPAPEPAAPATVPIQPPVLPTAPQYDPGELQKISEILPDDADKAKVIVGDFTVAEVDKMYTRAQEEEKKAVKAGVKEEVKKAQSKKKAAQQLRSVRRKLIHDIMREPGKSIQFRGYAEQIRIMQEGLDPTTREYRIKDGKQIMVKTMKGYAREQSRRFFEQNPEAAAQVPPETLERLYSVTLPDMSLAQLEEIDTILNNLRELGILKRHLELTQQLRKRARIKNNLQAAVLRGEELETVIGRAKKTGKTLAAWIKSLTPRRVLGLLDGVFAGQKEGEFTREGWTKVNDAWSAFKKSERERKQFVLDKMKELGFTLNPLAQLRGQEWVGRAFDIDGFRYSDGKMPTLQDVMYWAIGIQNERTRAALLEGNKLPAQVVLKGVAQLTEKQRAMAEAFDEDGAKNFPRYREAFIDIFNMDLPGEGHYVRMVRLNSNYEMREDQAIVELTWRAGIGKQFVARHSTYARIDISAEHQKPIRTDLFNLWNEGVTEQEGFIHQYALVKEMHNTFGSDQVQAAVRQKYGSELNAWLKKYTNDLAQADAYTAMKGLDRLSRMFRKNATIAWLGFNLLSVAKQTVGMFAFAADLGPLAPVYMLRASARLAGGWAKSVAGGHFLGNTQVDFVRERSEFVRNRQISVDLENLKHSQPGVYNAIIAKIGKYGMKPLEAIDVATVCTGWLAMYEKVMHETQGDEVKAIEAADATVMKNSPSVRVQDLAEIYRQGEIWKWFTMFTSELSVIWNRLTFDMPLAFKRKQFYKGLADLVAIGVAGVVISIASGALSGDDEERRKKLILGLFSEYVDSIPLIGNTIFNYMSERQWATSGVQLFPPITKWLDVGVQLSQGDLLDAAVKAAEATAFTVGLPWTAGKRVYTAVDEQNLWALLGMKKAKE